MKCGVRVNGSGSFPRVEHVSQRRSAIFWRRLHCVAQIYDKQPQVMRREEIDPRELSGQFVLVEEAARHLR